MSPARDLGGPSTFTVESVALDGARVKQTVTAISEQAARQMVMAEGLYPVSVTSADKARWNVDVGAAVGMGGVKMKPAQIAVFARSMANMLAGGLSVTRSLETTAEEAPDKIKTVIMDVRESVVNGSPLSQALGKYPQCFDDVFCSYVQMGEQTGDLVASFARLAAQTERRASIATKIKSVTTYPKMVSGVIFLMIFIILYFVVPQFSAMYASLGSELPAPTQMVVDAASYMTPFQITAFSSFPLIVVSLLSPIVFIVPLIALFRFYKRQRNDFTPDYSVKDVEEGDKNTVMRTGFIKLGTMIGSILAWNFFLVNLYNNTIGAAAQEQVATFTDGSADFSTLILYQKAWCITLTSPISWMLTFLFVYLIIDVIKYWTHHEETLLSLNWLGFKLPIFGKLSLKMAQFQWASTLSGAVASGIELRKGIVLASRATGAALFVKAAEQMSADIVAGRSMSASMGQFPQLFPPSTRALVLAGEESGRVDQMLASAADTLDQEVEAVVASLGAKMEVGLLVVMGAVVGVLVITMYLPIFQIANAYAEGNGA